MKKSTRFFALCLALTMCATMAMTGALGEAPQPTADATAAIETTAAPEATAALPTPAPDALLATVNGESVTYDKMQKIYDNLYYQYTSQGYDLTGQESILQSIAMDYAVQDTLFRQKAAEFKIDQFTAEEMDGFKAEAQTTWDGYLTQQAANYITSETPTDEEKANARKQAEDYMAQVGYTTDKALDELISSYKDQAVQERMTDLLTKDNPAYTDEEVQTEYQTRVDADKESYANDVGNYEYATQYSGQQAWYMPEGMRGITHILLTVDSALMDNYNSIQAQLEEQNDDSEEVAEPADENAAEATTEPTAEVTATLDPAATATPAPVTEADLEAAKQAILDSVKDKTEAIKTRYAAGEDFAALIAEYGTDPGMTSEPAKTDGYSVHKDSILYDPIFVAAAFAPEMQKVGDISLPVVSSFGVHILHYTRDIQGGPVALTDELKATLRTEMEQARKDEALPKAMEEWKGAAKIEYTDLAPTTAPDVTPTEAPAGEATTEPTATPAN
jgi:parvulin-like peptidyl-prolyl isomerase